MSRRRLVAVCATICAGVLPASTAMAHNGIGAAFKGHAGPYVVYAYDGESLPDGRLDYKLVLLNGKTRNPVYDTHPTLTATRAGAPEATGRITTFGNVVFYNLPNPYPHDWNIRLHITGPLGSGEVRYRMHGSADTASEAPQVFVESGSRVWPTWIGLGVGAVVVLGGVGYLLRRLVLRRRASPR